MTLKEKIIRSRGLKLCATLHEVTADVLLSNFYKIQRFSGKLNDAFSAQCRIVCLIEVFLVLVLHNPAVDNLQSCSFLERIPVGKRQCGQNLTLFRQRSLYFLVTLYYISLPLYSSFLSAVGDNSRSRVLQERSCLVPCQLGHY